MSKFKRIIGIDYGVSNTCVSYMDYEILDDGKLKAVLDMPETIKFDEIYTKVPTIVQIKGEQSQVRDITIGREALSKKGKYSEFIKEAFNSDFSEEGQNAASEFFSQVYEQYENQKKYTVYELSKKETFVSSSGLICEEHKNILEKVVEKSGFPNVKFMEDYRAILRYCSYKGYIRDMSKALIIDVGASCFRFKLCEYHMDNKFIEKIKTIDSYELSDIKIDKVISDYLNKYVEEAFDKDKFNEICKQWKKRILGPLLEKGVTVKEPPIELSFAIKGTFEEITRGRFEEISGGYISKFKEEIEAFKKYEINTVILHGGGSQWYFIRDIVKSVLGLSDVNINNIYEQNPIASGLTITSFGAKTLRSIFEKTINPGVSCAQISPDNKKIFVLGRSQEEVTIFNIEAKGVIKDELQISRFGHKVKYSEDEAYAAIVSFNGDIYLYRTEDMKIISSTQKLKIKDFCFISGGELACKLENNTICFLSAENLTVSYSFQEENTFLSGFIEYLDNLLAAGSGNNIKVLDTRNKSMVTDFKLIGDFGQLSEIKCAAFIDKTTLAVGLSDGNIMVTDLLSKTVINKFKAHERAVNSLSVSRKHGLLATAGEDGKGKLWDLSGSIGTVIKDRQFSLNTITFSKDEDMLLAAAYDGNLELWILEG
jgi:hypothetical protein